MLIGGGILLISGKRDLWLLFSMTLALAYIWAAYYHIKVYANLYAPSVPTPKCLSQTHPDWHTVPPTLSLSSL